MLFNEARHKRQEIFLVSNLKETDSLEVLEVDLTILL
jgi:hypothetical protein